MYLLYESLPSFRPLNIYIKLEDAKNDLLGGARQTCVSLYCSNNISLYNEKKVSSAEEVPKQTAPFVLHESLKSFLNDPKECVCGIDVYVKETYYYFSSCYTKKHSFRLAAIQSPLDYPELLPKTNPIIMRSNGTNYGTFDSITTSSPSSSPTTTNVIVFSGRESLIIELKNNKFFQERQRLARLYEELDLKVKQD